MGPAATIAPIHSRGWSEVKRQGDRIFSENVARRLVGQQNPVNPNARHGIGVQLKELGNSGSLFAEAAADFCTKLATLCITRRWKG